MGTDITLDRRRFLTGMLTAVAASRSGATARPRGIQKRGSGAVLPGSHSAESPGGIGETGTSAVVPALTNAIFAATGQRLRKLPIDPRALKLT